MNLGRSNLAALAVEVSPVMCGAKKAVQSGNTLYVSPAMFHLLSHADQKELQELVETIEVIHIPDFLTKAKFTLS